MTLDLDPVSDAKIMQIYLQPSFANKLNYLFQKTSNDHHFGSKLRCKIFANFFATHFCKPTKLSLLEVWPSSVIPFWKPLMTPNLHLNSDANFLKIFLQPTFANQKKERKEWKKEKERERKKEKERKKKERIKKEKESHVNWAFAWHHRLPSSFV